MEDRSSAFDRPWSMISMSFGHKGFGYAGTLTKKKINPRQPLPTFSTSFGFPFPPALHQADRIGRASFSLLGG